MEFVDGEPLSAVLARVGRLPVARTLEVLGQAAAALEVAHRAGMVHRDVKPGNLLVRPDGVVKITDFGIARAADAVPLTQSGIVVGTAQYFSPEQAEGRVVTAASDVYSLGVVGYECLAGRLPFVADSAIAVAMMQIREPPPPLPPDVPAPVRALVARAMAKDPRARFATGGGLAAAVLAVQQGRYEDPTAFRAAAPAVPPPGVPGSSAGSSAGPSTGPGSQGSTSSASAAITLDKNDYIGGDVNEVADRLRALQLVPVLRAANHRAGRPGEVVDLVWQGQLEPGSEIIVIAIPTQGRGKNR
jgi:serine/threonine-protein kinase